jgi:hypothetical protein
VLVAMVDVVASVVVLFDRRVQVVLGKVGKIRREVLFRTSLLHV